MDENIIFSLPISDPAFYADIDPMLIHSTVSFFVIESKAFAPKTIRQFR